ncbi:MAG: hypothetical protein H6738_21200 [Alphaproteobacteria bacterium]|nr:hypothetical protein [Alphaproteobacteria bacterium]MCB9699312.1 hypothetical protein [Alphaproteobacteria bacterium]
MGLWQTFREKLAWRLRHRERAELVERVEDLTRGWWLFRLLLGGVLLIVGPAMVLDGIVWGVPVTALALLLTFVGTLRRMVLAVGRPRAAAVLAWMDDASWARDRKGGYDATLAIAERRGLADASAVLDQRLQDVDKLTAGTVLASGLRAFREGRREDGALLLALVTEFDRSVRPPAAHRLATEAAMAEAAADGDLTRILELRDHPRAARSPLISLFVLVARRAAGEEVPDLALRVAAQVAAPLGSAQELLDRATHLPPRPSRTHPDPLVSLAHVSRRPLRSELVALARRLEDHLDAPERAAALEERRAALGARIDPVAAARTEVVRLLAAHLERARNDAEDPANVPACWEEAVRAVVARREERLAALADELASRSRRRWALPLVEEALASLRVEQACEDVVAADPRRRLSAHLRCWGPLVNHTVWLHNDRGQATLANALYRLQLRRAKAAGHPQAIELMEKNVGCGP